MPGSELGMVSIMVDKADGVPALMEDRVQRGDDQKISDWGRDGKDEQVEPRGFSGQQSDSVRDTVTADTRRYTFVKAHRSTEQQGRALVSTVDLS